MYETPKLIRVGEAREVILGLVPVGNDMDGNFISAQFEFAAEVPLEDD
jgi:hypothetical protein